jgi:hypothetical protein
MLSFEIPRKVDGKIDRYKITDEMFNEICSLTPWVEDTSINSLTERLYCIKHNIKEPPKCEICSVKTIFSRHNNRYSKSCSQECNSIVIKNKSRQTCLAKYGVEHVFQNKEVKEKSRQTCLEKYGVENPYQSEVCKEKIRTTCQEKYGVEYPLQSEEIKEKIKQTCIKKYGFENPAQSEEVKDKMKATNKEKYGVEYPAQSEEVRDKMSISLANNFQARRNEQGTDYSGSVYILHFPQHSAVKIGLTGDFDNRSKGLISDFGDYTIINIIETQECFALESSLHQKFKDYRICLSEGGGRTEFFKDEILDGFLNKS